MVVVTVLNVLVADLADLAAVGAVEVAVVQISSQIPSLSHYQTLYPRNRRKAAVLVVGVVWQRQRKIQRPHHARPSVTVRCPLELSFTRNLLRSVWMF